MVSHLALSPRALYHRLSYQNHVAAVKIQKFVRGVQTRNVLWYYERFGSAGFLFIEKVVKTIQRYFRGYLGRQKAAAVYKRKINMYAHRMQSLFFIWSYKRRKLISHLKFLLRAVTSFQSTVRRRIARRFVHTVRMLLHNRLARKIQRAFWRFIYGYHRSELQRRLLISLRWYVTKMRKMVGPLLATRGANSGASMSTGSLDSNSEGISLRSTHSVRRSTVEMRDVYELNIQIGRRKITTMEEGRLPPSVTGVLKLANGAIAIIVGSMLDRFLCYLLGMGSYSTCFNFAVEMFISLHQQKPFRYLNTPWAQISDRLATLREDVCSFNLEASAARLCAYSAIMDQWPRAGRNLIVRRDHAEEGLAILQQAKLLLAHFNIPMQSCEETPRMQVSLTLEAETETYFQAILVQIPGLGERTSSSGVFQRFMQQVDRLTFFAATWHSQHSPRAGRLIERARRLLTKAQSMMTDSSAYFQDLRLKKHMFHNLYDAIHRQIFAASISFSFRDRDMAAHTSDRDNNSASFAIPSSGRVDIDLVATQCGDGLLIEGTTKLRHLLGCFRSNDTLLGYFHQLVGELTIMHDRVLMLLNMPISVRPVYLDKAEVDHIVHMFNLFDDADLVVEEIDEDADLDGFETAIVPPADAKVLPPSPPEATATVARSKDAPVKWSEISDDKLVDIIRHEVRVASCSERFQDPLVAYCIHAIEELTKSFIDATVADQDYRKETLLCDFRLFCPSISLRLPAIDYRRRMESEKDKVDFSTRLLQKVFRGYRGRARFRRLQSKFDEIRRQRERRLALQERLLAVRRRRDQVAIIIQKRARGWLWRKLLYLMVCSATTIECMARCHRARKRAAAERRRRNGGPEIVDMTDGPGKSCTIGNVTFFLKVFRCGDNYKLKGVDIIGCSEFEGEVLKDQVQLLISTHNAAIPGSTLADRQRRIGIWQHERVVDLIVFNLGLTSKIYGIGRVESGGLSLIARNDTVPSAKGIQKLKGNDSSNSSGVNTFNHQQELLNMFRKYNNTQLSRGGTYGGMKSSNKKSIIQPQASKKRKDNTIQ